MELERTMRSSNTEDRISKLPDSVLHHIFSFPCLTARDLVMYSIVSERWKYLWKSMPFLHFDDRTFPKDSGRFPWLVYPLLILRDNSDLQLFRLGWRIDLHPPGQHHLSMWLQHVVKRNVKVIDLFFYEQRMDVLLPHCIFTSQSLEELKLVFSKFVKIGLPGVVRLYHLRKLHLHLVGVDSNSMDKLVNGCPVLEELTLEDSLLVSANIAFGALRDLTIKRCVVVGAIFRICCPCLLSCHLAQNYINVQEASLENLLAVAKASIHTNYDPDLKYHGNAVEFFRRNPNAEAFKKISPKVEELEAMVRPEDDLESLESKLCIFLKICPEYSDPLSAEVTQGTPEPLSASKSSTLDEVLGGAFKQSGGTSSSLGVGPKYLDRMASPKSRMASMETKVKHILEKCPKEQWIALEQKYADEHVDSIIGCGASAAGASQITMPDANDPDVDGANDVEFHG